MVPIVVYLCTRNPSVLDMELFNVDFLVSHLCLQPHPEGGFYRRTYLSGNTIGASSTDRPIGSAILYILPSGQVSKLHRIDADEMWHHYVGDQLVIVEVSDDGEVKQTMLGKDIAAGATPQHLVKAGVWFGAYVPPGSRGALVGCTVQPAFLFDTFQLATRDQIIPIICSSDLPLVEKLLYLIPPSCPDPFLLGS